MKELRVSFEVILDTQHKKDVVLLQKMTIEMIRKFNKETKNQDTSAWLCMDGIPRHELL